MHNLVLFFPIDFTSTECMNDGDIRLIGGQTVREGTVEICLKGTWGSVCDTNWGYEEAEVVCRGLGYSVLGSCNELLLVFL